MNFPNKERVVSVAAVVALAALLTLLGVLQYRWSSEISEAASARLEADLQRSMMGFRQAVTHELGEICVTFQMPSNLPQQNAADWYARRLSEWRTSSQHPALVKAIYLVEPDAASGALQLSQLDAGGRKFVVASWPADFAQLQPGLNGMTFPPQPGPPLPGAAPPGPGPHMDQRHAWAFDQTVPALVHLSVFPADAGGRAPGGKVQWLVLELDRDDLEQQLLPELARRQFAVSGKFDYNVAVLGGTREHPTTIYSSAANHAEMQQRSVEALNLFGPPAPPGPPGGPNGPPPGGFEPGLEREAGLEASANPVRLFALHHGPDDLEWQLVVERPGGSLEATVAALRLRNLAVSFGILLVLAATMAIIIVAAYRARRLAQLQMDFVTGVTHELRTPLTVILSAAENIKDGVVTGAPQVERYGGVIHRQARQLMELIEQVLLFSSWRQGRVRLELQAVELPSILERALENAGADGAGIERDLAPDLPPVQADITALTQCLQNMIANAIKYGGKDGWIGVRAWSSAGPDGGEVHVSIADHGIGIAPAELPHVFDAFYRSEKVAGSNVHGTGLGLPLARSLAEAMGGDITVTSQPGRGSWFTLHLRAASGKTATADTETKSAAPGVTR